MDILVNASDPEPFGIVLLEAHGTRRGRSSPVNAGGPGEIIEHGRSRPAHASSGEPGALADALEPLLASPSCAARSRPRAASASWPSSPTRHARAVLQGLQALAEQRCAGSANGRSLPCSEQMAGRPCDPIKAEPSGTRARRPSACEVTIVAHDIGPVGGMERQLVELVLGLRRAGSPRHRDRPHVRAARRLRGRLPPGARAATAVPAGLPVVHAERARSRCAGMGRGVLQATGAIVLNRVDVIAVHYCHQVGPATPSRATRLSRLLRQGWSAS